MSRTYRRNRYKGAGIWRNIESREEFDQLKQEYLSMEWKKSYISQWDGTERTTKWRPLDIANYRDYDHYLAAEEAKERHGYGWRLGNGPGWFYTLYFNRPLRKKQKQQIRRAWHEDNFEELVLEPYIRDSGWTYW